MAYQVDRFNGTFLTSVEDGTIDTTTDLRFVGKNYAGYGELQNENFLHLLENFANTTAPPKPISGQIWYDSGNRKLKFYDGSRFKTAGGAETGTVEPDGLQSGEFWFDTEANQLYVYNGSQFVLVGPDSPLDVDASAAVSAVVKDTFNNTHVILKLISAGNTISVLSKDEFTLNVSTPIPGFTVIKKGFTLINTNSETGETNDDHYYWGTASNALRLGGIEAAEYLRRGNLRFTEQVAFNDPGFTVGDQNDLRVRVENGDEVVLENQLGNPLTLRIKVSDTDLREVTIFDKDSVIPGTNDFYDLGKVGNAWKSVRATTFYGNLVGNVTGAVAGSFRGNIYANDDSLAYDAENKVFYGTFGSPSQQTLMYGNLIGNVTGTVTNALTLNGATASTSAIPNTIAARDSSANITANKFIGTVDFADRIKVDDAAVDNNPDYRSAKRIAAANSVAARDGSGNLTAVVFQGTATAARYADLAEKYLTDKDYDVGTVMIVGGEKEVTASTYGERAIGVISLNPAFMMNKDLEGGTYIALKGRVPVKVYGPVKKGDRLVAYNNGSAIVSENVHSEVFAIALESKDSIEVSLVEAIVL